MEVKKPVRRTQAQRSADTRKSLISAARKLFAEKGFAEVSTEAIVAGAGVTRGALYHQFADKAALFAAVYEDAEAQLLADVLAELREGQPATALEAMALGARAFLDRCAEPDVARIVLVDAPSVLGWDRWREVCLKYGLGVTESLLGRAVAQGELPEQPLRPAAHVLLAALDEAALYISRSVDPAQAREDMYAVCDRIIAGLATT